MRKYICYHKNIKNLKSKNDPKYHQDNDNDFGFYQI